MGGDDAELRALAGLAPATAPATVPADVASAQAPAPKRERRHNDPVQGKSPTKKVAKSGGGGKGSWGKPGMDDMDGPTILDERDPNYDPEEEEEVVMDANGVANGYDDGDVDLGDGVPPTMREVLDEYLESGVVSAVVDALEEHEGVQAIRAALIVTAVSKALERRNTQRELTSVLLGDLSAQKCLRPGHFKRAFTYLVSQMDDIILDNPEAPTLVAKFIARAVADDCVPPKFVETVKELVTSDAQKAVSSSLDQLLRRKHALVRLDNVWGVGGGLKPVKLLCKKIRLLLCEFRSSSKDTAEAFRCLRELDVPHFHHELVYQAVVMAMDNNAAATDLVGLLASLSESGAISQEQMSSGFKRVFDDIDDIALDVPRAHALVKDIVARSLAANVLDEETARLCPDVARGRKRYVSEGDGGLVKA